MIWHAIWFMMGVLCGFFGFALLAIAREAERRPRPGQPPRSSHDIS